MVRNAVRSFGLAVFMFPTANGKTTGQALPVSQERVSSPLGKNIEVKLEEAIGDFLLAGLQGGWSRNTHRQYGWHLERWRIWLDDHAVLRVDQLTRRLLRAWGASLWDRWSDSTVKLATITIRSFLKYCQAEGLITQRDEAGQPVDLAGALKVKAVPKREQRTIRADEMLKLLEQTQHPTETGLTEAQAALVCLRNAAILSLLYDSMLRAAELCRLSVKCLDVDRRQLVVQIKGKAVRKAFFGEKTAERLQAWLNVRQAADGEDAVFVSIWGNTPGQALTTRGLRIILKRLGDRAGVSGVSPHAFRRGAAVRATELRAPARILQEMARWEDIKMAETYTRALEIEQLYDEYCPVDSLDNDPDRPNRKPKKRTVN
jgi:site-specific recombinase XerD